MPQSLLRRCLRNFRLLRHGFRDHLNGISGKECRHKLRLRWRTSAAHCNWLSYAGVKIERGDKFKTVSLEKQTVKAIILAGRSDFGQCLLARHLPTALWPVAGKAVLERLLCYWGDQGIRQVTICFSGDKSSLRPCIKNNSHLQIDLVEEQLPVGTAGCIRRAVRDETDSLFLVSSASMVSPPGIHTLVHAHRNGQCDLTAVFDPDEARGRPGACSADIYICSAHILEYIRKDGYFDVKEGLIPEMLRAHKTIHTLTLSNPVGNFRDRQSYLCAIGNYLTNLAHADPDLKLRKQTDSQTLWAGANVEIDPAARLYGPIAILDGARVSKGVAIIGPAMIGQDVIIGQNSVVINSVIWDDANVGPNCEIQRCLIDYHVDMPSNTFAEAQCIPFEASRILKKGVSKAAAVPKNGTSKLPQTSWLKLAKLKAKSASPVLLHKAKHLPILAAGLVLIMWLWSYWPSITDLWSIWRRSDEYSSGLLVPFLALYILWSRRNDIAKSQIRPCLWGVCAFVAAQAVRLFGLACVFSSAENLSLALSIAAIVLLLFGWRLFRKVSTVLLFLCLMLPWPTRVQAAVSLPLQRWATSSAVFCLETIGYEVRQEGNLIHIGEASVAVAEACNGLRMVTAFFVISGLVVLLVKRPWWQKLVILASSLPTALLCNTTRLTITAIAFTLVSGEYWEKVFHDFGGYAMMPLALAIVVLELWILARLTMPPTEEETMVITRQTQRSTLKKNGGSENG